MSLDDVDEWLNDESENANNILFELRAIYRRLGEIQQLLKTQNEKRG